MPEIERLSSEQLEHLERLLAERGAPVVQRLQPPASAEALAAVEGYLGRPLPLELRQWWGWHDGTDVKPHEKAAKASIGPLFEFLGAEEALKVTRESTELAQEIDPDEPEVYWGPTWLAIGTDGRVACDIAIGADAPVSILDVDYHKAAYPGAVVAQSLGEMVRWWIEALESGAWRYDDEHDRWERRYELIPPERDRTGLV
ncbi:MAG: SMI1/KNR4 family protein [Actinomycetota bacterium]|nr:SMI1/KNR4 family protein [Actinomycetota bacterium]